MKDVIVFFFQGGIILILSIFIDSYFLYSNLYTENEKEESSIEKTYH
jgi:type III secretory pathway component EscT